MSNRFTSKNPSTPQGKRGRLRKKERKKDRQKERKISALILTSPVKTVYYLTLSDEETGMENCRNKISSRIRPHNTAVLTYI
jgi:hypothetical protein